MDWLTLACSALIIAGAGMMLASILRVREVLGILALAAEPHRSWLSQRIRLHRALMWFFLAGYVALAVVLLAGYEIISEPLVASVFFFGAAFVHVGVAVQSRMGAAMLNTVQGLVPMCAWCKRVNPADGDTEEQERVLWEPFESYFARKTEVGFTHGICPDCVEKLEAELPSKAPQ
jgi:hypothetical protein